METNERKTGDVYIDETNVCPYCGAPIEVTFNVAVKCTNFHQLDDLRSCEYMIIGG